MKVIRKLLPALLLLVNPAWAGDVPSLSVIALFKDRAVVMIDGQRRLLSAGQKSPEGVKLVSADSERARFMFDGQVLELALDGSVRAAKPRADDNPEVKIWRSTGGMFTTPGSINGMPVNFLVDTGASSIAMNSAQARRLGIDFRVVGNATWVTTASRTEMAYAVHLDRVQVGEIRLHNIEAVIIDGPQPDAVLLGMSFLGKLDMRNQDSVMTLRKKY